MQGGAGAKFSGAVRYGPTQKQPPAYRRSAVLIGGFRPLRPHRPFKNGPLKKNDPIVIVLFPILLSPMSYRPNRTQIDLNRHLESQTFETEDDLRKFIESFGDKPVPPFPKEKLTVKQRAQDLVFDAYETEDDGTALELIREAMLLDPNCIEAYELLAKFAPDLDSAIQIYLEGIAIGRKLYGGSFLEEHRGRFWGIHETRPFMRCLRMYSDMMFLTDNVKEAAAILEELIDMNPNDNQGVREQLLLFLIELDEREKFIKYEQMYEDSATAPMLFSSALFRFVTGEKHKANKLVQKAMKRNKFIVQKLLTKHPDFTTHSRYSPGDKMEADNYAYYAYPVWQDNKGALTWLKMNSIQ